MIKYFLAMILLPAFAHAKPLDENAFLNRCYAHLTGRSLRLDHVYRAQVKNGTKTALQICDSLIDQSILNKTDYKTPTAAGAEGLQVLRNFYDFHRTWFDSNVFEQMQGNNYRHLYGTYDNFDSTEPALSLTYNLFAPANLNVPYRQVIQGKAGYYALRELDPVVNARATYPDFTLASRKEGAGYNFSVAQIMVRVPSIGFKRADSRNSSFVQVPQPIQIGELVGIKPDTRSLNITNYAPYIARHKIPFSTNALNLEAASTTPDMIPGINIYENQGSGILGMNSFIFLNWGHDPGVLLNGAEKMSRRWSQAFMKSMLCRELPLLRQSDVGAYISTDTDPKVAPFRKSTTCLTCHATADQLSAAARNILISNSEADYAFFTNPDNLKTPKVTQVIGRFNASNATGYRWPAMAEANYHKQTPNGVLMFRSASGKLVEREITGITGVGDIISNEVDIYQCAAKRYLQYFTGLNIDLYDPGDPANATKINGEDIATKKLRKLVQTLGANLQTTQSLRTMMKELMRTEYYRDENYLQ